MRKIKANNGTGNIVDRDEWETPDWLFKKLNKQYNFRIDCCALQQNTKCSIYYKNFENMYAVKNLIYWMNPPFSKATQMFYHFFKVVKKGVAIYRCDNMETYIYQNIIFLLADWIFIIKGRVNYEGMKGSSCRFPSALIGVGLPSPIYIKGVVLYL